MKTGSPGGFRRWRPLFFALFLGAASAAWLWVERDPAPRWPVDVQVALITGGAAAAPLQGSWVSHDRGDVVVLAGGRGALTIRVGEAVGAGTDAVRAASQRLTRRHSRWCHSERC